MNLATTNVRNHVPSSSSITHWSTRLLVHNHICDPSLKLAGAYGSYTASTCSKPHTYPVININREYSPHLTHLTILLLPSKTHMCYSNPIQCLTFGEATVLTTDAAFRSRRQVLAAAALPHTIDRCKGGRPTARSEEHTSEL